MFKEEELRRRPRKPVAAGVPGQAGPRPLREDDDEDAAAE
jgi:hypothetical protein